MTLLEQLLQQLGQATASRVDHWAAKWLLARVDLPRDLALRLLEDLGRRVGARIEVSDHFGTGP